MKWKEMSRIIMISLTSLRLTCQWMSSLAVGKRQMPVSTFKQLLHPPELISKLCGPLKKSNVRIVENVRGHFDVPLRTPPIRIETDELRVGMKRAAAQISRSQYEIYSFSTRHELSEAVTDELLLLVGNVSHRI
jgi:hypothetical protein